MKTKLTKEQWKSIGQQMGWAKSANRTHYRNGEPIGLSCGCDGCNPSMINGVLCHETGCPYAWKDYKAECFECGSEFYPEQKGQRVCPSCANPEEYVEDTEL